MSVFVMLHVPGDPNTFEKYAANNTDLMRRVAEAGRAAGAIHHAFGAADGEIVVIDEWPSEAAFKAFFDSQPDIPTIMREGGAQGAPTVVVYRKLDTPDVF